MAIIGIGTDIVEIKRIESLVFHNGDRLARRVLSLDEWLQYQNHKQAIRFLAKRFTVKEAASKAFGVGIRNGLSFSNLEIYNDKLGKPTLRLFARAATLAAQLGITRMHVTLADERYYAYSTVIFENNIN